MTLLSSIQSVGFELIGSASTTVCLYISHSHGCRPHLGIRRLIHKGIIENPTSSFSSVITLEASCFRYFAIDRSAIFCKLRKMKGYQESEIKTIAHVQFYSLPKVQLPPFSGASMGKDYKYGSTGGTKALHL